LIYFGTEGVFLRPLNQFTVHLPDKFKFTREGIHNHIRSSRIAVETAYMFFSYTSYLRDLDDGFPKVEVAYN